jgi:hypothetical protein
MKHRGMSESLTASRRSDIKHRSKYARGHTQ